MVFSICYKITGNYFDAEDLTQDTFLSAYKNLAYFDGMNEKSWICKIATNKCLDYGRAKSRGQIPTEDNFFKEVEDKGKSPEIIYMEGEVKEQILCICNQLKPPYDEVAKQYFYEEKTIGQMAEEMNRNEKTLQTQVYRAKAMIRKFYRKEQ